ncbi:MAG: alpha/beta fold hydrolase [Thermoleophilaceae bacterium]
MVEGFCRALELDRFAMFVFDFGARVGFRLATRHPEWIAGLVVQNGNAYEAGLSEFARDFIATRPEHEGAEAKIREILTLSATRDQYLHRAGEPEAIAPDGWTLDHHFLKLPGRKQIQVDLAVAGVPRDVGVGRWRHRARVAGLADTAHRALELRLDTARARGRRGLAREMVPKGGASRADRRGPSFCR